MFRFWYRYVFPNRTLIETGAIEAVWEKKVSPDYSNYMGLVFEKICGDYLCSENAKGNLPFLFAAIGRWWGTNSATHSQEKIDIVANSSDDYLIGECKWRNEKTDMSVLSALKRKADVFNKNRGNTWFVLFSKSGFTNELVSEAAKDNRIILVDTDKLIKA